MFAPEDSQLITSACTATEIKPGEDGTVEMIIPKRELAVFEERTGKYVLESGIYMFEIKGSEDALAGRGVVKQIGVLEKLCWDE